MVVECIFGTIHLLIWGVIIATARFDLNRNLYIIMHIYILYIYIYSIYSFYIDTFVFLIYDATGMFAEMIVSYKQINNIVANTSSASET